MAFGCCYGAQFQAIEGGGVEDWVDGWEQVFSFSQRTQRPAGNAEKRRRMGFSALSAGLCEKSFLQFVGDPDDSILDQHYVEVDEQTQALVWQFQLGQELSSIYGRDLFNRFDFHYDSIFHYQVCEESLVNVNFFVDHRNGLLTDDSEGLDAPVPKRGRPHTRIREGLVPGPCGPYRPHRRSVR